MRRALALVGIVLLLAGCSQSGLPLGPTVAVPAGRFDVVQGQADLVVRTFVEDEAGVVREVGGADCAVASILFSARLTTPARFVFPSFGPQSPTLAFECRAGDLAGRAEQGVVSRWVRYPGAWPGPGPWPYGYGGWGGPWGWDGWGGSSYVTFAYPDVAVWLRKPVLNIR